jgi:hypothetical protein
MGLILLSPFQVPFEEFIVHHETGWELSSGEHDWFIRGVDYKSDLYVNQSTEILVMVDLNGSNPSITEPINGSDWSKITNTMKAGIYFEHPAHSEMWIEMGFLPSRHWMTPPSDFCPIPFQCFSYLLNWSYPSEQYAMEVDDEWGRTHWAEPLLFFVNVSAHDGWETLGWYRYPSFIINFHTIQEWEATKPPPQGDHFVCGTSSNDPYDWINPNYFVYLAILAILLWYSRDIYCLFRDIYRFIKRNWRKHNAQEKRETTPKESLSESDPKTKTS